MSRPVRRSTLVHALGFCVAVAIAPMVAAGPGDSPGIHHCNAATAIPVIDAAEPLRLAPSCIVRSVSTGLRSRVTARVAILDTPEEVRPANDSDLTLIPAAVRELLRQGGHALLSRFASAAVGWLTGATNVATPALIEVEVLRALLAVRLDLWLDGASRHQRSAVDKLIRARAAALLPSVLGEQVGGLAAELITPRRSPDVMVPRYRIDLPSDRPPANNGLCARPA